MPSRINLNRHYTISPQATLMLLPLLCLHESQSRQRSWVKPDFKSHLADGSFFI